MAYILEQNGLIVRTFTVDNATMQTLTAGTQLILQDSSGRPFAIIGASLLYTNATIQYKSTVAGAYAYLFIGGQLMGQFQDLPPATSLDISPGFAFNYQVNYDQSAPSFCAQYRDDEISIDFDGSYQQGDGEFIIKVVGFYF
jgi:hypothetical protein